ncbi:MAG: hypothetical protein PHU85_11915 [Phycisphaerae bacterium]|nr:hypothetical protein [Phycisphaerae bacterium]
MRPILVLLLLTSLAAADEVKINVIRPDETDPTRANVPATQPAPPTSQPSGFLMLSNDPEVDRAIDRLQLSVEQFLKIQPMVGDYGRKTKSLLAEFTRASDAVRGGVDLVKDTPESRLAFEKLAGLQAEYLAGLLKAREDLAAAVRSQLDSKQSGELDETLDEWRGTPTGKARARARQMLERMTRGVKLTEAQRLAAGTVLREFYLAHDAEVKALADRCKSLREQVDKAKSAGDPKVIELELAMKKSLADFDKAAIFDFGDKVAVGVRPKVLALLTPEQRATLAKLGAEEGRKLADSYINSRLARYAKVQWSAAQQGKVTDLTDAVRAAMLALDPEDQAGHMELSKQFDRDVGALLTPEQRSQLRGSGAVIIRD